MAPKRLFVDRRVATELEGRLAQGLSRWHRGGGLSSSAPAVSPEVAARLADQRSPAVGVTGPLKAVPFGDGVFIMQSSYATEDAAPRLKDIVIRWGGVLARGSDLSVALERAQSTAGAGGAPAEWSAARRWFERMDDARRAGYWTGFGRAYDELRRLLNIPTGKRP